MTVVRWILGVVGGLFVVGWLIVLLLYAIRGDDRLLIISKRLRHWATLVLLSWLNLEVWGRVVWAIVTWPR